MFDAGLMSEIIDCDLGKIILEWFLSSTAAFCIREGRYSCSKVISLFIMWLYFHIYWVYSHHFVVTAVQQEHKHSQGGVDEGEAGVEVEVLLILRQNSQQPMEVYEGQQDQVSSLRELSTRQLGSVHACNGNKKVVKYNDVISIRIYWLCGYECICYTCL